MTYEEALARLGLNPDIRLRQMFELGKLAAQQEPVAITTGMALAFHRALTDGPINDAEAKEIKIGLEAAFAHITTPQAQPAQQDRVRELECVIADLKAECQALRAQRKPLPQTPPAYANINQRIAYKAGWRDAETAHGIKGGA